MNYVMIPLKKRKEDQARHQRDIAEWPSLRTRSGPRGGGDGGGSMEGVAGC